MKDATPQVCSESRLAYLLAAGKLGWVLLPR